MSIKVSLPRARWLAVLLLLVAVSALNLHSAWLTASVTAARFAPSTVVPGDENWDTQFTIAGVAGTNSNVSAIAVSGSEIYVGGSFTTAGGVGANNIAKWNGSAWSALGDGVNGAIHAIDVNGNDVYVGGDFTIAGGVSAPGIAKWNGSAWVTLGSGVTVGSSPGSVSALAASGNEIYVGGFFSTAGGVSANNIAKWNGSVWSALGSGVSGSVRGIRVSGSEIYVGGYFTTAGGVSANRIAKWNGNAWSALGSGLNGRVEAVAVSGSELYVGGDFSTAGGVSANRIAKWNGNSWAALGGGVGNRANDFIRTLAVNGGEVYVGGQFFDASGVTVFYLAKWNGSNWSALGSAIVNGFVFAITASGNDIYIGGGFATAGTLTVNRIAKWNGSAWESLGGGNGLNNLVRALGVGGNNVYVGGPFDRAGGSGGSGIARWNGSSWFSLGSLVGAGSVNALAVVANNVYAGGGFGAAVPGASNANRIARWNGSAWATLGSGVGSVTSDVVNALAVSGSELYAGGSFTTAGGASAHNIARWNGSVWAALGAGVNGAVNAIAVRGSEVYVGGAFTTAGGTSASRIARWNGAEWAALGSGLDGEVKAIVVSGSEIYVGGSFITAGGISANRIAKWNGTSWAALGSGLNGPVNALAMGGGELYAGGDFTLAGGIGANRLARWNGSDWAALGSGTDGPVFALAVSGGDLYAGGNFTIAGAKPSAFFGRYRFCTVPSITAQPTDQTVCASAAASFSVTATGTNLSYQWRKNGVNLADGGGVAGASAAVLSLNPTSAASAGAYDVVVMGTCGTVTSAQATLTVNTAPSLVTQPLATSASVGASVSFTAAASGSPTPAVQWQVSTDDGVTFNNLNGAVNPTLTLNGVTLAQNGYRYRALFSNSCGSVASMAATLTVNCQTITINPATIPAGMFGAAYSQTFTQGGGSGAVTWSLRGTPPTGLSFNTATATLSGAPTQSGSFPLTVIATDANACTGARDYTLVISNCPALSLTPVTLGAGTVNATYNQTLTASGGVAPYSFSVSSGSLPAGLTLSAAGSLSGLASTPGTFNFTVKATDANGCSGTQAYTLTVNALAPALTSLNPNLAIAGGVAFTLTVNGTGFSSHSVVRWNGNDRTTSFVSDTQLRATIPASDIATMSTASIVIFTPAPGGGATSALPFTIAAPMASVSTASFLGQELAQESIIAAFGSQLATEIKVADTLPLPTTLAGTTLKIKDSLGAERLAPLFFVAPTQINYLMPIGTAPGAATVTVLSGNGSVSAGVMQITAVAPGLFSANANGQGVAAGAALRLKPDGTQSYEPLVRFDHTQQRFVAAPLDLSSAAEQVFLILFGTGFRQLSNLSEARVRIGGQDAEVSFAGAQGGFAGLDQLNVRLPHSLRGRGEVEIVLTVSGKTANIVKVSIR